MSSKFTTTNNYREREIKIFNLITYTKYSVFNSNIYAGKNKKTKTFLNFV